MNNVAAGPGLSAAVPRQAGAGSGSTGGVVRVDAIPINTELFVYLKRAIAA
jgi:hypothetical protein